VTDVFSTSRLSVLNYWAITSTACSVGCVASADVESIYIIPLATITTMTISTTNNTSRPIIANSVVFHTPLLLQWMVKEIMHFVLSTVVCLRFNTDDILLPKIKQLAS